MTSTIDHDRSHTPESSPSALHELAAHVGILPAYLDIEGRVQVASDDSRRAILSALGFDVSSSAAEQEALDGILREDDEELVPPVRVVRQSSSAASAVEVRLPARATGVGSWKLELVLENSERHITEGAYAGTSVLSLSLHVAPPIGYHQIKVYVHSAGDDWSNEQTLIIVPDQCWSPTDVLGDSSAFGLIANLYTVRSNANWGIGDLSDLACIAEWGGSVGADFVGMNPLHALLNRGTDVSPYSPVSRVFRNPIYIDVMRVPELRDASGLAERLTSAEFIAELEALRETSSVRYEQVMGVKGLALDALHRVFLARVRGSADDRDQAYDAYLAANEPTITRFATWMAIAESGLGYDWRNWPSEFRHPDSAQVWQFAHDHMSRVDFHRWAQFELDRQLGEASADARAAGMRIGLYPDLAIGTSPAGADAWAFPELFVRGVSIGAPPDPYAATGQNWGLPPIAPRAMRRNRYQYFINLLRSGFRHAGALRIDHVLGLFRLFWIPDGLPASDGAYMRYPADDLLGIIALESVRHRALVVGEDLGTVPPEIPPALASWGVLSSKVLYFERDHHGGFKTAASYPSLSLATANTHDMPAISGFWNGRDIDVRRQVGLIASNEDADRAHADRDAERSALLRRLVDDGVISDMRSLKSLAELRGAVHAFLCRSPARLVGISLDDLTGEVEPVNVPGVGPDKYSSWTRKMRDTLETFMISDDTLTALRCDGRGNHRELAQPEYR
jgi:4-alpha-glucanotransferase